MPQTAWHRHATYYSGGVHNDKGCLPPQTCIHRRKPENRGDPHYPQWWTSKWTMYRVFSNYDRFPPRTPRHRPVWTLRTIRVSYGASYYDATYLPPDQDGSGAMMERYEKFCLPIFPSANNFSCAFVSLGNKAYFLRFEDRPWHAGLLPILLHNHPPTRDFIKHLPYNAQQSTHLGGSVQAYSRQIGPQKILFGCAFEKQARSDEPGNPQAPAYRHPQSFFFSGSPTTPPDAPIVSQNYTDFRADQPDPRETWDKIAPDARRRRVGAACLPATALTPRVAGQRRPPLGRTWIARPTKGDTLHELPRRPRPHFSGWFQADVFTSTTTRSSSRTRSAPPQHRAAGHDHTAARILRSVNRT